MQLRVEFFDTHKRAPQKRSTSASVTAATVVATAIVVITATEQEVEYDEDNDPFVTAVVIASEHKLICSFQILYYKKFLPALHIY